MEANKKLEDCTGAHILDELCTGKRNQNSGRPPRIDYKNSMLAIQTKFDLFMNNHTNGAHANKHIQERLNMFEETVFVSMIPDAGLKDDDSFERTVQYMKYLPQREKDSVDDWIEQTVNENASKPSTHYSTFNSGKYRDLIGIREVRGRIQSRWLKAFNMTLPTIKSNLARLLAKYNLEYDEKVKEYVQSNPAQVRTAYLTYVNEFRRKIAFYAAYKSEIEGHFPHAKHGTSYEEVERDFQTHWSRWRPLTWPAYLNANELKKHACAQSSEDQSLHKLLDSKLLGSSHFDRLQKLFAYMVLALQHDELTADEIATIESLLYGGLSCSANMDKFVRDMMRRLVRKTFAVGIAWLTQMYTYLLDTFREAVTSLLLSENNYAYLKNHSPFLKIVELDYHRKIRTMTRRAIYAVRDTRFAYSAYAHYDLTARLKKLSFYIPVEISHELYLEKVPNVFVKDDDKSKTTANNSSEYRQVTIGEIFANIEAPRLISFIFGSESYLTTKRDQKSGSHHPSARQTVRELYTATCGKLLYDIAAHFNAHVVIGINEFDQIEPYSPRSITTLLTGMSDFQIARMADIDFEKVLKSLDHYKCIIGELTEASILLNKVSQQLHNYATNTYAELDQFEKRFENSVKKAMDQLDHRRKFIHPIASELSSSGSYRSQIRLAGESNIQEDDEEAYEIQVLLDSTDEAMCKAHLEYIYQRHDNEDLRAGLLEGESLDQDSLKQTATEYQRLFSSSSMNSAGFVSLDYTNKRSGKTSY
ncbi:hypothetical protein I4U23_027329 [Adineta vaga]|nr:hypothetical protein I4U23_027329 [Adineta vaga]